MVQPVNREEWYVVCYQQERWAEEERDNNGQTTVTNEQFQEKDFRCNKVK